MIHDPSAPLLAQNSLDEKFSNREDRLNFVRKVYGIIFAQLLFTSVFIVIPLSSIDVALWMRKYYGFLIAAIVGQLVTSIALICCRGLSRKVPTNYVLLGIFTLCEAYLIGFIAAQYEPYIVLAAAFSTAAITGAISFYAYTTKKDFTVCGPMFLVIGLSLCMTTLFIMIFGITTGNYRVAHMVICGICIIIFSFYLLFDTQLIMGGKRYEIEMDDYVLGAIILYTDIITIFLYLLRLFGGK